MASGLALIWFLATSKRFSGRYGLCQPLMTTLVFTVVFGHVAQIPTIELLPLFSISAAYSDGTTSHNLFSRRLLLWPTMQDFSVSLLSPYYHAAIGRAIKSGRVFHSGSDVRRLLYRIQIFGVRKYLYDYERDRRFTLEVVLQVAALSFGVGLAVAA